MRAPPPGISAHPPQVAGLDTSSALGAFEKMEEKVMALEAQAEAAQMVSGLLCRAGLLR